MIRLFVFNNASRAANYGIGTYIKQLSGCLHKWDDAKVSFVEINADTKEFVITKDAQGHLHYQIPVLSGGKESDNDCRIIFYLLSRHIDNMENDKIVFQFNYFQHRQLAELLKGYYINSRIILTVHYLGWCFELKGNYTTFRQILSHDDSIEEAVKHRVMTSYENEKRFLYLADEVLVLSKWAKKILVEDYNVSEEKLHTIYNGLETISPFSRRLHSTLRKILFVGRLDENKGVEYLIKAFKKLLLKHEDSHLVVIGDGNFQPYLTLCRDYHGRISFFGKVECKDLEDIYQSAYIGVIPSFNEQCCYSVIEMMRHGIPVVGTDSTGLSEMFDYTPYLRVSINENKFDEENFVNQLATCMDTLLSDDKIYQEASKSVRLLYDERYQARTMLQRFQQVLHNSFIRPDYIVSSDYFIQMDYRMFQLINQQPDIDVDFFGLSGIGVYLWWRVLNLESKGNEYHLSMIQEHLIYYIDWLLEVAESALLPIEMIATLKSMHLYGFYKNAVSRLLARQKCIYDEMPSEREIIQNTFKICNCKV